MKSLNLLIFFFVVTLISGCGPEKERDEKASKNSREKEYDLSLLDSMEKGRERNSGLTNDTTGYEVPEFLAIDPANSDKAFISDETESLLHGDFIFAVKERGKKNKVVFFTYDQADSITRNFGKIFINEAGYDMTGKITVKCSDVQAQDDQSGNQMMIYDCAILQETDTAWYMEVSFFESPGMNRGIIYFYKNMDKRQQLDNYLSRLMRERGVVN